MSARKKARLLELAKEIVRREGELSLLQREFERLTEDGDRERDQKEPTSLPRPPLARTSSYVQRVQSTLDLSSRPMSAHEIAAVLREPRALDTIRAVLSKLIGRETVERVAPGMYRSLIGGHRSASGDDD